MHLESRRVAASVITMFLLFLGASASAKDTGVKFDREADFSKYHKYGWADPM